MDKHQRLVLIISILASFVAFLDGSVVNVALPAISRELGGGLLIQQWVSDAYLITLGTLILAAGSLSDIFGRKRILTIGLYGFLVASLLCAVAQSGELLIISRALQGISGALLVPSSLALIISVFRGPAQSKAIGSWTAWTGIAFIIGPLVGGLMVDLLSWRFVFAINIIPIVVALLLMRSLHLKDKVSTYRKVDFIGIVLGAIGLGGIVYALIEQSNYGWGSPLIYGTFALGLIALASFIWHEGHIKHPMLPLGLFSTRNLVSVIYRLFLSTQHWHFQSFVLVIFLQQTAGYTATFAGLATIPITIIMFFLSSKFGALSGKFGSRLFMGLGPVISGAGVLLLLRVNLPANYWTELLPGIITFGLGLSVTVAPLTSAILGSIKPSQAGIGSAVNNAVARIAGLLSVAVIGVFIGKDMTLTGFHEGLVICAVLLVAGGIISAIGIQNHKMPVS